MRKIAVCQNTDCKKEHRNAKYCSSKCSAICTNKKRKRIKKQYFCLKCGKFIGEGFKFGDNRYCTDHARNYRDWSLVTFKILKEKLQNSYQVHARIRSLARELYKKHNKDLKCKICGYNTFVEICHIKPVKDFPETSSITEINNLNNLTCLCRNHHWEFDHGLIPIEQIKIPGEGIEPPKN